MKFFLFICIISTTCNAQVLTTKAKNLQKKDPAQFHAIETFAYQNWKFNDERRIKEINDQTEAYLRVWELVREDLRLHQNCMKAIKMSSEESKKKDPFLNPTINWKEVLFEIQAWMDHKRIH